MCRSFSSFSGTVYKGNRGNKLDTGEDKNEPENEKEPEIRTHS